MLETLVRRRDTAVVEVTVGNRETLVHEVLLPLLLPQVFGGGEKAGLGVLKKLKVAVGYLEDGSLPSRVKLLEGEGEEDEMYWTFEGGHGSYTQHTEREGGRVTFCSCPFFEVHRVCSHTFGRGIIPAPVSEE